MIKLIRHAPSTFNASGMKTKDAPIVDGKMAKSLNGHYDLVICSTLKRARQTLDESNITYGHLIFTNLCREYKDGNPVNLFEGESDDNLVETEENFAERINEFKNMLKKLSQKYNNIAVMGHGIFFYFLSGHKFSNCEEYEYKLSD